MGQIIGRTAKPDACNLRSLSSFGTPAAGQHILVSTDNSAMQNGQGNFDAYVVGDGQTAASGLILQNIRKNPNGDFQDIYIEKGGLRTDNGAEMNSTTNIRSKAIYSDQVLTIPNGYLITHVIYYNSNNTRSGITTLNARTAVIKIGTHVYARLLIRKDPSATTTDDDIKAIQCDTRFSQTIDLLKNELVEITNDVTDIENELFHVVTQPSIETSVALTANVQKIQDIVVDLKQGDVVAFSISGDDGILVAQKKAYFVDVTNASTYLPTYLYNSGEMLYTMTGDSVKIRVIFGAANILQSGNVTISIQRKSIEDDVTDLKSNVSMLNEEVSLLNSDVLEKTLVSSVIPVVANVQKVMTYPVTLKAGEVYDLLLDGDDGILVADRRSYFLDVTNTIYYQGNYQTSKRIYPTKDCASFRVIMGAATILQSGNVTFTLKRIGIIDNVTEMRSALAEVENVTSSILPDTLILPEYYHDNNYIDNKVTRVNELASAALGNGDAFIFITDEHWLQNAQVSPAMIKYLCDNSQVKRVISGGDTADAGSTDFCRLLEMATGKNGNVHHVIGNHEYDRSGTDSQLYYMMDFVNNDEIGNPQKHWYYVDNIQGRVRYIILNSEGENAFSTEQLTFFTSALNVQSGWKIIIFMHHFATMNWLNDEVYPPTATGFVDAISNYSGDGEIVAVIQGHFHRDRVTYMSSGIPIIMTACDKYVASAYQSTQDINVTRTKGTITEQAFDVFIFDFTNRIIKAVRFGAPARDGVGNNAGDEVEERTIEY